MTNYVCRILSPWKLQVISEKWAEYQYSLGNIRGDTITGFWYKSHYHLRCNDSGGLWFPNTFKYGE